METNQSEVARLREQIDTEYAATRAGMDGLSAGSARHDFITARMQRGAERILKLIEEGNHDEAVALMETKTWGLEGD